VATIAFFYEALTLLVVGLLFVSFVRSVQGVPVPSAARRKHSSPLTGISVVLLIEPNVDPEHAVASLQAQKYPKLDLVIVLSDGAGLEERTRSRLEADARVRLIETRSLTVGWTRQNEGYAAGFRAARHDYVLFMDANVMLRAEGVERALGLAKRRGTDLLTIFPAFTAISRSERLMIPFFLQLTLAGVSLRKINDANSDAAGGFAPFFLFRRAAYEALGGHAAVRADRFSDSTLAQTIKDRGYRLLVANGTDLAVLQGQARFRDIWTSWSESFNEAIDNNAKHAALLAALVLALFAVPWLLVAAAVLRLATSPEPVAMSPWLGVVIIGIPNIMLAMLHRRALRNLLDIDDSLAWLQPLAAIITAVMIVTSSLRLEESWLGRLADKALAGR